MGKGTPVRGEWQPHHTRHGTRMDKQPTILAVHSPSRIRNAIARVLPLATPLWVGPMCGGWPRPRAEAGASLVFRFLSLYIVPTLVCTTTPANFYGSHIKYKISRISYTMQSRPGVGCATPHASTRADPRSPSPTPICGALSSLRIGDSKDSHLSRLSLVCCA